jgi:hypothetical protein
MRAAETRNDQSLRPSSNTVATSPPWIVGPHAVKELRFAMIVTAADSLTPANSVTQRAHANVVEAALEARAAHRHQTDAG